MLDHETEILGVGVENRDPRREEQESETIEKAIITIDAGCEESDTPCVALETAIPFGWIADFSLIWSVKRAVICGSLTSRAG